MTQLTLYTNPMSRGRTARWMLEEVGQRDPLQAAYLRTRSSARRCVNCRNDG
jgi:hypothetical protein